MAYRIIPRSEWGARYPNGFRAAPLPAREVWLHHSVTIAPDLVPPWDDDFAAIRTLEQIGQTRFGGGISYTWCITPAGLVFEGHSVDRQGSHTGGRNDIARAICLVGNYEVATPTRAQLHAAAWLLGHAHQQRWIDEPRLDGGHRDLKQTACPGQHAYAQIPTINRLAAGPPIEEDDVTEEQLQRIIGAINARIDHWCRPLYQQATGSTEVGDYDGWSPFRPDQEPVPGTLVNYARASYAKLAELAGRPSAPGAGATADEVADEIDRRARERLAD